ncbi:hypothetical protein BJ912DRAFT_1000992 [Pholiota molesta]|nr:hypothetical protein BJ912DRAFT_1000992 [Pholiota molesta]
MPPLPQKILLPSRRLLSLMASSSSRSLALSLLHCSGSEKHDHIVRFLPSMQADLLKQEIHGNSTRTLQKAFASRGLGLRAESFQDDATIDADC